MGILFPRLGLGGGLMDLFGGIKTAARRRFFFAVFFFWLL